MFIFLAGGCGGTTPGAQDDVANGDDAADVDAVHDGTSVVVDARVGIVVRRDGIELIRFPLDGFALGAVDDDAGYNYDPWWLEAEGLLGQPTEPPRGLRWLVPSSASNADATSITLAYAEDRTATLAVVADADEPARMRIVFRPERGGEAVAYLRASIAVADDERFYGLGNQLDRPELRGKRVALQLEADPTMETFYNERHVTTPLLVATSGWGVAFGCDFPGVIDVAAKEPARVEAVFGIGVDATKPGRELAWDLLVAHHPLDVYRHYYAVTGPPRIPAEWAFGPWFWRDETPGEGELEPAPEMHNPGFLQDVATIRALDLPTSGIWIDRPYASALQTFDFDPARYDDAAAMIATAHAQGLRVALWHAPYMTEAADALYDDALAIGAFPPVTGIALNTFNAKAIDFTNPAATAFWQEHLARYTALGIEGYKLDFGEDIVPGIPGARANIWQFHDGDDERTMHARYAALYHAPYLHEMPAGGGFILARAAGRAGHTHVDVLWPGDLDADFARHRDPIDDGGRGRVGGIPAALVYHLSVAASGFPFFAPDTGGYRHGPPSAEAFSRWFEMTALAPVMQVGGDENHAPWELATFGFDKDLLDRYRVFARLHMRLFPFFRSEAERVVHGDGRPIVNAFGLARPDLGVHPADAYFLGDALLVAPVIVDGEHERDVPFPRGRWRDWWDGSARDVSADLAWSSVAAPLGRPPVFMAEGAIVPMLRPEVDTLAPASDPTIDSADNVPGRLWIRIAGRTDGSGTSYDVFDGGRVEAGARAVTWHAGDRYGPGVVLELVGRPAPSRVTVAGRMLPAIAWDALAAGEGVHHDGRSTWIALSASAIAQVED